MQLEMLGGPGTYGDRPGLDDGGVTWRVTNEDMLHMPSLYDSELLKESEKNPTRIQCFSKYGESAASADLFPPQNGGFVVSLPAHSSPKRQCFTISVNWVVWGLANLRSNSLA